MFMLECISQQGDSFAFRHPVVPQIGSTIRRGYGAVYRVEGVQHHEIDVQRISVAVKLI